jgi:hypothetical protein
MSSVLGISISTEGDVDQTHGKVYIANHITNFDHLAISLTGGGILVGFGIRIIKGCLRVVWVDK